MQKQEIMWAKPMMWGGELDYIRKAFDSTWISAGPFIEELETRIATRCEMPYALAVANGTAAIHLVFLGLGIEPSDEVVVPGFGFLAAANVALHMHAKPVFADVDPETWCVNAASIEACLTNRTRAIVPIHTYGNMCEMDKICDLAHRHGIPLVEDVAEAFCSTFRGKQAGSFGSVNCFSFQATKTITTGEGGLVLTRDKAIADRMALFRSHGMLRKRYWHEVAGHNFRLTNLQAALGCSQLDHIGAIIHRREQMHAIYRSLLGNSPGITLQHFSPDVTPVLWALACRLDAVHYPQGRDEVMVAMADSGIETRPGFYPPSAQPLYQSPSLPVAEQISQEMICLPFHPGLRDEEIEIVCSTLLSLGYQQNPSTRHAM